MADLAGYTRAQTKFLRACRKDPCGLSKEHLPNAATFRCWMRRPTFRKAVKGIRDTLRYQADLQLSAVSAVAARALNDAVAGPRADEAQLARQRDQLKDLVTLLKLVHTRERFTVPREPTEPPLRPRRTAERVVLDYLRRDVIKPYQTIGELIRGLEVSVAMERRGDAERAAAARRPAA